MKKKKGVVGGKMVSDPPPSAPPMPEPSAPPAGFAAPHAGVEPQNPYAVQGGDPHKKLLDILTRYEVTIADAQDLTALEGYEIIFVVDDSGSMQLSSVPVAQRRLGVPSPSRWDELRETVRLVAEVACCFDDDGIDIHFLNRPSLHGIRSPDDPSFVQAFAAPPHGSTPLTETLQRVISQYDGEKPVLVMVATDGEPNGGPTPLKRVITDAINRTTTTRQFRFQILACTDDDDSIAWINKFDEDFTQVDATDDFYSERAEVLRTGRCKHFTRGDWIMKALLGPVSRKFDEWDESGKQQHQPAHHGGQPYGHHHHQDRHSHNPKPCKCVVS